jgi:hypothetical protein
VAFHGWPVDEEFNFSLEPGDANCFLLESFQRSVKSW